MQPRPSPTVLKGHSDMSDSSLEPAGPFSVTDLQGSRGRVFIDQAMRYLFLSAALTSVVIGALIILSLVGDTVDFLSKVDLGALTSSGWFPRRDLFDVRTIVVGSLLVTAVAMLVAGPLGLAAAIYLSEYANPRVRRVLKPILEVLAGIPSVVLGVFALTVISPEIVQRVFDGTPIFNLLTAGIGVGLLTIPIVASVSEDALHSVPNSLREASFGMGANRMITCIRVVIPAAVSGLVAAFILAISRAIGETLVVAIVGGANGTFTANVLEGGQTMTAAMANVAPGSGSDQARGGLALPSLYFVGSLLFLVTLVLNVFADRFVRRVRQKY